MTALVTINEAEVVTVNESGKSFTVNETITTKDGRSWPRRWLVVTPNADVKPGEVINVTGELGVEAGEHNGKPQVNLSLWNPTFVYANPGDPTAALGATEVPSESTPF